MAFVTYFSAKPDWTPAGDRRRIVARIFSAQGPATARAAAVDGETAYVGAVSDEVDVGWWIVASGAGAGTVTAAAPALDAVVQRRRAAARRVHEALQGWSAALTSEGVVHPASIVAIGHDYLYRAHQAVYIMAHRNLLAISEFEDWCSKMAMGASDVTSPSEFFARMEGPGVVAPSGPCAWARWGNTVSEGLTTAVRVPLAQAITVSGPTTLQAPGNLNLLVTDLPQGGLAANGAWIDRLAA